MILTILGIIALIIIAYLLFVNFYPSFGGTVTSERQEAYATSPNFRGGKFVNTKDVPKELKFSETLALARKFFFTKVPNGIPEKNLEVEKIDSIALVDYKGKPRLIWFGHSAFLLQIQNKNILIDPMFGKVAAPHNLLGANRFNSEMPIEIEELPKIDAVIISHDHYDHLDYGSIRRLADKVEIFYTPLGVGVHLEAWGITKDRIHELDWWQETQFGGVQLVCTPAQHFSGRKINDGQSTLWSSWVIKSNSASIFFSGDSGYAPHFKEIGTKYGPFDFAMLECGQYNEMWPDIHMFPEETAQAALDLKADLMMPIHWGAFKLALHEWTDPVERVIHKAHELGVNVTTPKIGKEIRIKREDIIEKWWINYN